jgi:signal transduction histidine kinase/CheY-like chemotaxis protein
MATILVLDDRRSNREVLVELLREAGHALHEAGDGAEALVVARRERPDVVIADILMPTMDGYGFVRQLRSDPAIAATPVIFYTATYQQREARELADKCGVRHLLAWPVEPAEILRAVEEVLGQGRSPAPGAPAPEIDQDHLRLLTDTLAAKVRELEEANRRLTALSELGRSLAVERDPVRLLDRCCRAGRNLIGARQAILAVLAEEGEEFRHVVTDGLDAGTAARLRPPTPGPGLLRRVLAAGVSLRIGACGAGPPLEILPGYDTAGSFLAVPVATSAHRAVPVATSAHRFGLLAFVDKLGREEFSVEDEELAVSLAAQLALALEDAQRQAEIERHTARLERYAERLAILRRIDREILAAHRPRELAAAALQHLRQLIPCWHAGIWVFDWPRQVAEMLAVEGGGVPFFPPGAKVPLEAFGPEDLAAVHAQQDRVVEDVARLAQPPNIIQTLHEAGLRSYMRLPMASEGQVIGSLLLGSDRAGAFETEQVEIARQVADQLAIAIRHALLFDQVRAGRERLQALSHQLLVAQEEERRRIARELHDEIGQSLTAVRINLQLVMSGAEGSTILPYLKESDGLVDRILQQVRNLSLDLRPSVLDDLGLVAAVRWSLDRTCRRAGFQGQVTADPPEIRLPSEIATACFRIVQEALTNVVRHAGAHRVEIVLSASGAHLELVVRDDGSGLDVAAERQSALRGGSLGLLGMQERVALLGGRIAIESAPGQGTTIFVRLPLALSESVAPLEGEKDS